MKRNRKIVLVSHCVLNQNAVVKPLARAKGPFEKVVSEIVRRGIGIVQLPCPETLYGGLDRQPMSYDAYNLPTYRTLCQLLAKRESDLVESLIKDGVTVVGIIGIDQSPTCSQTGKIGHFMEAIHSIPSLNALSRLDIPETFGTSEAADAVFYEKLADWLDR